MEEEERKIEVMDEKGNKLDAKILYSFEVNGENFVMYAIDDNVYGAKIADDNSLGPIEEDEWPLVEKIFDQFMEEQDEEEDAGLS